MTAGLNCRGIIVRQNQGSDDSVGGAVYTGTSTYFVHLNLMANPVEQVLAQQGLQTPRTFSATLQPGHLDIRERDELQIDEPTDHPYYGVRFRITGVRYSNHNLRDPRSYMLLDLIRSVRAHDRQ